MAIETIKIADSSGKVAEAKAVWYTLNDRQQFVVIGVDDSRGIEPLLNSPDPSVEAQPMGRLDDVNFIMKSRTVNSLVDNGWDFELYPNPELILLTKTT